MLTVTAAKTWHNDMGGELVTLTSDGVAKVHPLTVSEGELRDLAAACTAAADAMVVARVQQELL